MRHDTSTSNLKNHADLCSGSRALTPGQGTVEQFARGSTYSKELLRVYVGLWMATSYRPFTIVKDPYFIKIIEMFNPKADLPSDTTISRDIKDFFEIGQANLKAFIETIPGAVHIALDGWSSPNTIAFLGVVLLYLDPQALTAQDTGASSKVKKAPIKSLILDFIKLSKAHTGEYLATKLNECLKAYNIRHKVCIMHALLNRHDTQSRLALRHRDGQCGEQRHNAQVPPLETSRWRYGRQEVARLLHLAHLKSYLQGKRNRSAYYYTVSDIYVGYHRYCCSPPASAHWQEGQEGQEGKEGREGREEHPRRCATGRHESRGGWQR